MQSIFLSLLLLLVLLSTNARSTSQPSTAPRVSKAQLLNLFSGGFAGTVSSTITSPLEVVKTQLQASSGATSSPLAIAKSIYKQDGIPGFWRGLPPTLVGIIPARSIYFASYEGTKTYLTPKVGTGTVNALMSGLAAGIAANTATNPIWMVKTRMQVQANRPPNVLCGVATNDRRRHTRRNRLLKATGETRPTQSGLVEATCSNCTAQSD